MRSLLSDRSNLKCLSSYPNSNTEQEAGYMGLKFKGEVNTRDVN